MILESPLRRLKSIPGLSSPTASLGPLLQKGFWGIADQALLSATNFATLVFVARGIGPREFGSYALTLTFVTLVLALQTGLLNRPYSVIGASRSGEGYQKYVTSVVVAQCLSAGAVTVVLLLAALVLRAAGFKEATALAAIAGPAIVCWGLQEFIRQVLYAEGRLRSALINDAVSYGGQLLAVFVVYLAGGLTAVNAFAIVALTSLAALALGAYQIRGSLTRHLDRPTFLADASESWRFGRWLGGGALLMGSVDVTYSWMIAGFVSIVATGAMRTVTALMGPTHILLKTMDVTLTPIAARVVEREGVEGLRSLVWKIFVGTAPFMVGYCLLVSLFAGRLLGLLYGSGYAGYGWLVQVVALTYVLAYAYEPVSIACAGLRRGDVLFRAQLWQAGIVLLLGVAATYEFGLLGAALTMTGAALAQNFEIWRSYLREVSQPRPSVAFGLSSD